MTGHTVISRPQCHNYSFAPTTAQAHLAALSLHSPIDKNWYLGSGATSHMSFDQGNISFPTPTFNNSILVDNGESVPIQSIGSSSLSSSSHTFSLPYVLCVPLLRKSYFMFINLPKIIFAQLNFSLGFCCEGFVDGENPPQMPHWQASVSISSTYFLLVLLFPSLSPWFLHQFGMLILVIQDLRSFHHLGLGILFLLITQTLGRSFVILVRLLSILRYHFLLVLLLQLMC